MRLERKFKRQKEDFRCRKCGVEVKGDGYTNHCPKCLWSQHMDINPGDRAERCRGMMRPMEVKKDREWYFLIHRCEKCGQERKNRTDREDDFNKIVEVVKIANNKVR